MDEKAVNEFIKRKAAKKVIKSYLSIKKLKEDKNYGNEYIKMMYKINPSKYEAIYNDVLDDEIKAECEAEIKKEIEEGKLDLDRYLVEMYKENKEYEEYEEER